MSTSEPVDSSEEAFSETQTAAESRGFRPRPALQEGEEATNMQEYRDCLDLCKRGSAITVSEATVM